ncbi:uncharacterized protein LOC123908752 isoform X1 [Trifolium pratense]|uniref:uncharacterized protein LOC123908752 isoform X1 n=1 Tax=Trifolium pratense TaxID=57577 RepID=UPI001E6927B0|nr:uncharacterized protein LOC123908752 isoform X1 [Trifolium pratense]
MRNLENLLAFLPCCLVPKEKKKQEREDDDSDEPKGKEKRQKGGLGKGFHAPLQLSDALAKFLGESATSDVIKRKWDYIKGNNLQPYVGAAGIIVPIIVYANLIMSVQDIPRQFRNLLEYWEDEKNQEVSHQNAQNIAQLKYRHRTGNKTFAVIREKMRVSSEDKEPPTQAQVFIATRQSRKGKELDKETNSAIIKLQDMIENNGQPSSEAFQSIVGKEKPGRMRCHGRTTTLTLLKRNEEIKKLKREHADEVAQVRTVV